MKGIFAQNRRRFMQLSQIAIGSGIGVLLSHKFRKNSSSLFAAESQIYYVSPLGKDSHPGTLEQPWKTIQKAADTLQQVTYPIYLEEWAKDYVYETKGTQFIDTQPTFKDALTGNFYLNSDHSLEQSQQNWGAFSPNQTETFWWIVNFPPMIQH